MKQRIIDTVQIELFSRLFYKSFLISAVARIERTKIAGDRETTIDNWIFRGEIRFVEIPGVFHVGRSVVEKKGKERVSGKKGRRNIKRKER
jgi:hypothetical protein